MKVMIQKNAQGKLVGAITDIDLATTNACEPGKRLGTAWDAEKGKGGNLSIFGLGKRSTILQGAELIGLPAGQEVFIASCSASVQLEVPLPAEECRQGPTAIGSRLNLADLVAGKSKKGRG